MVDSIGWKATRPVGRVTTTAPAGPVRTGEPAVPDRVATSSLARQLAASAPVDLERVSRIKKAIADGRFPIVPSTIADRLLAFKLEWNPNDPSRD